MSVPVIARAKQFLPLAVGQGFAVLGGLVGVKILTSHLSQHDYGRVALCVTAVGLANTLTFGPLAVSALRLHARAAEHEALPSFAAAVQAWFRRACLLVAGVAVLAATVAPGWRILALLVGLLAIAHGGAALTEQLANAQRRRGLVAMVQAGQTWSRALGGLLAVLVLLASAETVVACHAGAVALLALGAGAAAGLGRRGHLAGIAPTAAADIRRWGGELRRFGTPFVIWGVFGWLALSSDRWVIGLIVDTRSVGVFAGMALIASLPFQLLGVVVDTFIGPVVYARTEADGCLSGAWRIIRLALGFEVLVAGLAIPVLIAIAPWLVPMLTEESYSAGVPWLPWIAAAAAMNAMAQTLTLAPLAMLRSRYLLAPKIGVGVVGLALNVCGTLWYGVGGLVVALCVTGVVNVAWLFSLGFRMNRKRLAPLVAEGE